MTDPAPTFEQAFAELEEVVARLEAGGLSLEETLSLYERGQALAAQCAALLDSAQLRLEELRPAPGGGQMAAPLDEREE